MEKQSLLYTELHLALLDVVKFHEDVLQELALSGKKDPEHDEKMELFKKIKSLVNENAHKNFEFVENEKKSEAEFLETRLNADYETCEKVQRVEIVGEDIDEETGLKRDIVVCTVCGDEFMPMKPNNWDDRITWGEYVLDFVKEMSESSPDFKEKMEKDMDLSDIEKQKSALRATHEAVLSSRKVYLNAMEEAENSLNPIYDDLLLSKLNILNYNQNSASA